VNKPLGRLAGAVLAGVAITFAVTPAALAQDEPSSTTTTTSDTSVTTSGTPTPSETPTSSTAGITGTSSDVVTTSDAPPSAPAAINGRAKAADQTAKATEPSDTSTSTVPPKKYTDNVGHGFIGLTGEGVLVIACAEGAPGNVSTANLTVTAGPDQDEADGRYWNYDVRVAGEFQGTTSTFSWTCAGQPGQGSVEFQQAPPTTTPTTPTTPTTSSSGTAAPSSTVVSSTSAAPGLTRPKAQVRYAPQGGIETGFGGMAGA
jgi:hypothetical protein